MTNNVVVALDVGGTFVKACIVEHGEVLQSTISQYDAFAKESEAVILNQFVKIILDQVEQYQRLTRNSETVVGDACLHLEDEPFRIGFTFPGPFDYEAGICWIQELDKFESLYGVNVREKIIQLLQATELAETVNHFDIKFQNDGRLFGLGASKLFPQDRLIAITLGTGIGSAFIDRGAFVTEGASVPMDGYLYHQPHRGTTADEYFSRRGILKLFHTADASYSSMDVKELAELARSGDVNAKRLFTQFGEELGIFLTPHIARFEASRLLIGGQIAKSFDLFSDGLYRQLKPSGIQVEALEDALYHTFNGVSRLFEG